MSEEVKKCPYCGEEILRVAIKCKHCGSDLRTEPSPVKVTTGKQPWIGGLGFGMLAFGALACVVSGGNSPILAVVLTIGGALVLGYALISGNITLLGR